MAPLPRLDTGPFLPHILTTDLHLGSLPSTACSSTWKCHLPIPTSFWLSQTISSPTFVCINILPISSQLFFLFTAPMKMGQCVLQRHHIIFRCWGITQKKEYNKGNCCLKFVHQLIYWWLWRCWNTGVCFKFTVTLFLECLPYIGCHNKNLVFQQPWTKTTIYSIAKRLNVALYLHSGTTRCDLCHLQIAN